MAACRIASTVATERTWAGNFLGFSEATCVRFICEYTILTFVCRIRDTRPRGHFRRIKRTAECLEHFERGKRAGELDMQERLMSFSARMARAARVVIVGVVWTEGASARDCLPQPGFKDTPHQLIAPLERLVSHTEEITVDRP